MDNDAGTIIAIDLFGQHANGFFRLGDIWKMAKEQSFNANFIIPGFDNHFTAPCIYLGVVNLMGDPSMGVK